MADRLADRLIVSRHPAAVEFVRRTAAEFADAPVLLQAGPQDVRGKVVAGNLPLQLAALAWEVVAVEFEGQPPRGQEYSLAEMEAAGARLRRYIVLSDVQVERLDAILHSDGYPFDARAALLTAKTGGCGA